MGRKPIVGMGVTVYIGSDRAAGTITKVNDAGTVFYFQRDIATRVYVSSDDPSEQRFKYTANRGAPLQRAFRRANGKWYMKIGPKTHHVWPIILGHRDEYDDPSF